MTIKIKLRPEVHDDRSVQICCMAKERIRKIQEAISTWNGELVSLNFWFVDFKGSKTELPIFCSMIKIPKYYLTPHSSHPFTKKPSYELSFV